MNRSAYDESLMCPGSLTIWFDRRMMWDGQLIGKRSPTPDYGHGTIQSCLTVSLIAGMMLA
jgi:hypothetical protein